MRRERRKGNYVWFIVACISLAFVILSLQINELMARQTDIVADLSQVEYLSSSTQRLGLMVITGNKDNRVIFYINEQTKKYLLSNSAEKLSILDDDDIGVLAENVITNWDTLFDLFQLPEDDSEATYDVDSIVLATNNHFNSMTNLSLEISKETEALNLTIEKLQLSSYFLLACIAFCVLNHIASTSISLKRSNDLAAVATIDISTGLYNRSRCQQLFKDSYVTNKDEQPAVLVIDLNDLKKTNDIQGHRVGDELISTFASLLKESAYIHPRKPFIGRYGGDEFVVYHKNVNKEEDVLDFMKKLASLCAEFNDKEDRKFNVSYAIGYAINKEGKEGLSTQQLFDEADECMYTNKKAMKKLLEQHQQEETQSNTV